MSHHLAASRIDPTQWSAYLFAASDQRLLSGLAAVVVRGAWCTLQLSQIHLPSVVEPYHLKVKDIWGHHYLNRIFYQNRRYRQSL